MSVFNQTTRTKNAMKSSIVGVTSNVVNILMGFIYRSIFLHILSANYLGLNGLFTNILQVLSLAELGITTAITYRFYEPICNNDVKAVGELMNFFKWVYRGIALFIFGAGMLLYPFLEFFIKDKNEVPVDVNLQLIYVLFLLNTVSTYLFVYKQTLLSADQKNYLVSFLNVVSSVVKYVAQIVILIVTHNYTLVLEIGILVTVILNFLLSIWITNKYKPVFCVRTSIEKNIRNEIIKDTKACMLHKIGATVKIGTDNIILSKMISLMATGIYSNYALLINSIQTVLNQLLGSFASTIGNAKLNLDIETHYKRYKALLFIDLWVTSVVTTCVFVIINDFMVLWVGGEYLFSVGTVASLCIQMYIMISRYVNISYTNACGLFTRDKIRPVIEALLNLIFSVVFAKYLGIVGVFLGTVISSVLTICWREPIILYKYEFKKNVIEYWKMYSGFFGLTVIVCIFFVIIKSLYINVQVTWLFLIMEGIIVFLLSNIIIMLAFARCKEFGFCSGLIKEFIKKKTKK